MERKVAVRMKKLEQYIKEEKIMEFDSDIECMNWFNDYDFQNFKTIEDMKMYQDEFGFNIGEKRYHILVEEALDVYGKKYRFTEKGIEAWHEDILNDCLEEKEKTEYEIKISMDGREISIPTLADNIEIIYGAVKECRENTITFRERRKVMISSVTGKRKVVLITDATEERIEEVISDEEVKTHGFAYIKGELEKHNYIKELIDTNFDDECDVDVIGYDEYYTCK